MTTIPAVISVDDTASIAELLSLRHAGPAKRIDPKNIHAAVNEHLLRMSAGIRAMGIMLRDTPVDDARFVRDVGFMLGVIGEVATELCMLSDEI